MMGREWELHRAVHHSQVGGDPMRETWDWHHSDEVLLVLGTTSRGGKYAYSKETSTHGGVFLALMNY